jgi:hypothetical protein
MTMRYEPGGRTHDPEREEPESTTPQGHGGHGWMMIACCVPMLVVAIVLVATGVASFGFLIGAVMCTAMMAMMMAGMGRGDDKRS